MKRLNISQPKVKNNVRRSTNLNTIILRKTTASKPSRANISSSDVSQAFTIQLGEGTNLSKQKVSQCFNFFVAIFRPKYTVILLGCFRNMEYKEKSTTQIPILIPTEVRRAENSISLCHTLQLSKDITTQRHPEKTSLRGSFFGATTNKNQCFLFSSW